MLVIIILIIIFISGVFIYKSRKKHKIDFVYNSNEGKFLVEGNREKFIIKKDNRFEFLVENGLITAVKDKRRHKEFIRYIAEEE